MQEVQLEAATKEVEKQMEQANVRLKTALDHEVRVYHKHNYLKCKHKCYL